MSDSHCPSCGSCGFPMREPNDFAGGKLDAPYCATCGDDSGQLKPFEEVLELNAAYFAREQRIDLSIARAMARNLLLANPAWQKQCLN